MTSETLRFFLNQPPKRLLTGKKAGKTNIQKFEHLENEKSFLDEIKTGVRKRTIANKEGGRGGGGSKLRNLEGTYFSSASHSTQTE